MSSDKFGTICRPDCSRCRKAAWAWANLVERDGYGNVRPETCEELECSYCVPTLGIGGIDEQQ